MRSRFLAGAVALATSFVWLAPAALAEPPIGSRLGDRLQKKQVTNERDAAEAAHQLAACLLAKRDSAGRDFLAARSQEEVEKLARRLQGSVDCFSVMPRNGFVEAISVTYAQDVLRGNLAEVLLKGSRPAVAQLQPIPVRKRYVRNWFAFSGRHTSVDEMAACVADANPSEVMALIETAPFTDAEDLAVDRLIPDLGPCLQVGTTLDAKREPLRAALAEALYQRFAHPGEALSETGFDLPASAER